MPLQFDIRTEATPNPDALKFVVGETLVPSGSLDFSSLESAAKSPLATALFGISGVAGVFIAQDFVTLSKTPETVWETIIDTAKQVLQENLVGENVKVAEMIGATPSEPTSTADTATTSNGQNDAAIEAKIKAILDNEIRPAVAMDGGDVIFDSYENGIVKMHLQGACSSCPSSIMTLKSGVENRLKMEIPEIKSVVQV